MKIVRQKRIYILPTRFGFVFLAGAILMILIGASYQNNLVNLLSYFMLSLIFIAMIQTHNNLKDIRVEALETEGGFKGTEFVLTAVVANDSKDIRFGIEASYRHLKDGSVYENFLPLLSRSTIKLRSSFIGHQRGRHEISEVKLSSSFPLGLFRAWIWVPVEGSYFVYPEPVGERPLPLEGQLEDAGTQVSATHGDDFYGHRKFEAGDSPRHIDWKAHARGRTWLVKEFGGNAHSVIHLDWSRLESLPLEQRLSQLSRWIEEARKSRLPFSLKMPHHSMPLAQGYQHARSCLELLAIHQQEKK
jgi:uncharacterized protein (DUF58 family)